MQIITLGHLEGVRMTRTDQHTVSRTYERQNGAALLNKRIRFHPTTTRRLFPTRGKSQLGWR